MVAGKFTGLQKAVGPKITKTDLVRRMSGLLFIQSSKISGASGERPCLKLLPPCPIIKRWKTFDTGTYMRPHTQRVCGEDEGEGGGRGRGEVGRGNTHEYIFS